jgi:hypothetical protein
VIARTFAELVKDLRMRRAVGDRPPVLLLGAGASVDAGIGAMDELFRFFGCADFPAFSRYIATTNPAERYRYLAEFLQTRQPAEVTPGYRALAALCAQNYFDLVLTTNMDPLLDDALAAARLWRRDYLLIVNGVIRPERLDLLLRGQSPRVRIVKLHGDLFQRFMAWTEAEMDIFLGEVSPYLQPAVAGRDFLVVGYSLRDARVRQLVERSGGAVWFTHPSAVPDHLEDAADLRAVVAPECAFERFFPSLAAALLVEVAASAAVPAPAPAPAARARETRPTPGARTMDDLMASVVSVAGADGTPSSTAFLLAEPRVIVCDTHAVSAFLAKGAELTLIATGGRRLRARVVRTARDHPFGPTLLAAPADLAGPGLALDRARLEAGKNAQAVVAAGEKTGISTAIVRETSGRAVRIEPIGPVRHLVSLDCFVRPGASGAPVVDADLRVRGFIVAGSSDPDRPISYMYPAAYWGRFAVENERAAGTRRRRGKATGRRGSSPARARSASRSRA